MKVNNWEDMKRKYPEDRADMTEEVEREFVRDCFELYEKEGFAKKFVTPYEEYWDREGEAFEVVGRCAEPDTDLCVLPMWLIKFQDGTTVGAYPEEIIESEQEKT